TALRWFKQAAAGRYAPAVDALGQVYARGLGVKADPEQARAYYRQAAAAGYAPSQVRLALIYSGAGKNNPGLAADWAQKAAAQDYPPGEYVLADFYRQGIGISKSRQQALALLQKAAEQGLPAAQLRLGDLYRSGGDGVRKNTRKALAQYQKAVGEGNAEAMGRIGESYLKNDAAQAFAWFQRAAAAGDAPSAYRLGLAYRTGNGLAQDSRKAAYWLAAAVAGGYRTAKKPLGRLCAASPDTCSTEEKILASTGKPKASAPAPVREAPDLSRLRLSAAAAAKGSK
ncbi:MAG: tetratricopeptide repeat protein, partial [Gammaproteobacteria bacterium]